MCFLNTAVQVVRFTPGLPTLLMPGLMDGLPEALAAARASRLAAPPDSDAPAPAGEPPARAPGPPPPPFADPVDDEEPTAAAGAPAAGGAAAALPAPPAQAAPAPAAAGPVPVPGSAFAGAPGSSGGKADSVDGQAGGSVGVHAHAGDPAGGAAAAAQGAGRELGGVALGAHASGLDSLVGAALPADATAGAPFPQHVLAAPHASALEPAVAAPDAKRADAASVVDHAGGSVVSGGGLLPLSQGHSGAAALAAPAGAHTTGAVSAQCEGPCVSAGWEPLRQGVTGHITAPMTGNSRAGNSACSCQHSGSRAAGDVGPELLQGAGSALRGSHEAGGGAAPGGLPAVPEASALLAAEAGAGDRVANAQGSAAGGFGDALPISAGAAAEHAPGASHWQAPLAVPGQEGPPAEGRAPAGAGDVSEAQRGSETAGSSLAGAPGPPADGGEPGARADDAGAGSEAPCPDAGQAAGEPGAAAAPPPAPLLTPLQKAVEAARDRPLRKGELAGAFMQLVREVRAPPRPPIRRARGGRAAPVACRAGRRPATPWAGACKACCRVPAIKVQRREKCSGDAHSFP